MPSSDIQIKLHDGKMLPAYFARPAGNGAIGGIVLLQEIFGINANMRAIADDYAARGIYAIAPDLFWRQEPGVQLDPGSTADRERATVLMKGMDQSLAIEDALAAAEYLRSVSGSSSKVGAVGYCLGGKLAYILATRPGIDAAVSYYGVAIQAALDMASKITSPLLLHIAEEDHLCPEPAQAAIRDGLARQPQVTIMSYPGVGHAFARRGGAGFDAVAAERADLATWSFLTSRLKSAG